MRRGLFLACIGVVTLGLLIYLLWEPRAPERASDVAVAESDGSPTARAEPRVVSGSFEANRLALTAPEPFDDIARRAEAGDPVAQRLLGQRYMDCMAFSFSPETHKETLRELARMRGLPEATATLVTTGIEKLCGGIDGGQPIPLEAGELWLEQAARSGDLVAQAALAARRPNATEPEEVNDLLVSAIQERNPNALLAAAPLLGVTSRTGIDPEFAALVGSTNDEYAWAIAACRMGADCGPGSRTMTSLCLSLLYCNYSNYEQFIRAELLPDGQLERVDRILALVRGDKK